MKYTVKAAARATGISESRLRTWERRYGVPKPGRSPTSRRLYDDEDLALIRRMATLVDSGVSAVDAAEAVRLGEASPVAVQAPREHALVGEIVAAADVYDESRLVAALRDAVTELGWGPACDEVVFPALRRVGLSWETASIPPAKEHFASEVVRREIAAAISAEGPPAEARQRVLMACPESERHDLGLLALCLLLRFEGVNAVYLGADVPTVDLIEAYEALRPEALCLSATSANGLASLVRASRTLIANRRVRLFIGGPAVSPSGAEAIGVRLPASLPAAAKLIRESIAGEDSPAPDTGAATK